MCYVTRKHFAATELFSKVVVLGALIMGIWETISGKKKNFNSETLTFPGFPPSLGRRWLWPHGGPHPPNPPPPPLSPQAMPSGPGDSTRALTG